MAVHTHLCTLLTLVALLACNGDDKAPDSTGTDTDPTDTTDTVVDTNDTVDTVDTIDTDDSDDSDGAVVVPDFDPDSVLGRALTARCDKGVSCGEAYTCSGEAWDSVDSCLATIYDDYAARSDADLAQIETLVNGTSCALLFEGFNGFCNNDAYTGQCDCPANPCTLQVPATADVIIDSTVSVHQWSHVASGFGGAHDYAMSFYVPELTEGQEVAIRLGFTSPLVLDPGGPGQLVAPGLLRIDQTSGGGVAHPYSYGAPTFEFGPGGSSMSAQSNTADAVSVQLDNGSIDCALFTFEATGVGTGAWPFPLMGVAWRSTLASGSEPPGFRVDGNFTRP